MGMLLKNQYEVTHVADGETYPNGLAKEQFDLF
jgi:hypothetical protein